MRKTLSIILEIKALTLWNLLIIILNIGEYILNYSRRDGRLAIDLYASISTNR
jgi:hypothetical protein